MWKEFVVWTIIWSFSKTVIKFVMQLLYYHALCVWPTWINAMVMSFWQNKNVYLVVGYKPRRPSIHRHFTCIRSSHCKWWGWSTTLEVCLVEFTISMLSMIELARPPHNNIHHVYPLSNLPISHLTTYAKNTGGW